MARRYAPYYRVSHKDNERGISIELQREHCEPCIARRSGIVVPAYIDEGKSAFEERLDKRPAFQRLLNDAKQRRFDAVIVYMFDRFGRRMRVALQAIHELELCGVSVESATEANDWLSTGINLLMAEQYSRALSKRMKDVRLHEAKAGRWVGSVPVGYDRVNGFLVQNNRAPAVLMAGQLYATGDYGTNRITQALNNAGYTTPTGELFKATAVEELLKCPAYAGFVTCGGQIFKGNHEAIWDAALWQRIQDVAQLRSFRRTQTPREHNPLLAGLAYCGACGAAMWHNSREQRRTYRCAAHDNQARCSADLVCIGRESPAPRVEMATLAYLAGMALSGDLLLRARELRSVPKRTRPDRVDVEQRLKRLARAYADGAYSDDEYEARRSALLALQQPAIEEDAPPDDQAIFDLLADLPTLLAEATDQHRRAIVRELLDGVWIKRNAVLAVRPTRLAERLLCTAQQERDAILQRGSWWAGWAFGLNIPPSLMPRSLVARTE